MDLGHAEGPDPGLGSRMNDHSQTVSTQSRPWLDTGRSEKDKSVKGKSSEATDLETFFFEKHERRNWNVTLFNKAGSVRIH